MRTKLTSYSIFILFITLVVTACSPNVDENTVQTPTPIQTPTVAAVAPLISTLDGKWAIDELTVAGEIIELPAPNSAFLIIEDDKITGNSGCNDFSGTATFDKGSFTLTSALASTSRMCIDDEIMIFEAAFLKLLEKTTTYTAGRLSLQLDSADDMAVFSQTTENTLYIGAEQVDCVGVGPQKCLLVKEAVNDEYSNFYAHIAGFEWEAGFEYELLVTVIQVLNPPADASSLRYELVEIVSQQAVAVHPSISTLNGKWAVDELTVAGEIVELPTPNTAFLIVEDGKISGNSGCNEFSGTATFDEGAFMLSGALASTKKMCPDEIMTFETAFLKLLGDTTTYASGQFSLQLDSVDGMAVFSQTTENTLYIGAEQVDCVGVGPQKCLLVKEAVNDEYSNFYTQIAGFEWEAGFEYELLVTVIQVLNPPADASSLRYELVEIVSQQAVAVHPSISTLNGKWAVDELTVAGEIVELPTPTTAFLIVEDGKISGNSGCNEFSGTATFNEGAFTLSGALASTKKMCPDEIMTFETAFLKLLGDTTTYASGQFSLQLDSADGMAMFSQAND